MEMYPEKFSVQKSIEEVTNVVSPMARTKILKLILMY
jgi:hypothetical protein